MMNKVMTFGLGMLVGAFGIVYMDIKNLKESFNYTETDDYEIHYKTIHFTNGNKYCQEYYKRKDNE